MTNKYQWVAPQVAVDPNDDLKVDCGFVNQLFNADPKALRNWLQAPENIAQLQTDIVDGKTPMSVAVMFAIRSASHAERNIRMQIIRVIADAYLANKVDVNTPNKDGSTGLSMILEALSATAGTLDKVTQSQFETIKECLVNPKPMNPGIHNQRGVTPFSEHFYWIKGKDTGASSERGFDC